jgi:hypothetical protein
MKVTETKLEQVKNEIENAIRLGSFQSSTLILLVLRNEDRKQPVEHFSGGQFQNLSKLISEKLVIMSNKDRERNLQALITELVTNTQNVCYFSRINLLFEESLNADPLKLLQSAAKKKPIVVIWPGYIDSFSLNYANPGLPDYKSYKLNEFQDVQVITTCEQGVSQ